MKKKPSQDKSKTSPKKKYDAKSSKAKSKNSITRKNKRKKLSPWLFFLLLIPIALAFFFSSNITSIKMPPDAPNETTAIQNSDALPTELSVSEAHALYTDGAFILDVREADEWHQGHIPGATLIPPGKLDICLSVITRLRANHCRLPLRQPQCPGP